MNKTLNKYNKILSKLANKIGYRSLFSPTLCRIEAQTNLFRKIYIKHNKSNNITKFKEILRCSSFLLKPLRDLIFLKNTPRRKLINNPKKVYITYGDYRNVEISNKWREEMFRGLQPSRDNILIVISLGKSIKDINQNIDFINKCSKKEFIYSIYSFINIFDIFTSQFKSIILLIDYLFQIINEELYIDKKNIKPQIIESIIKDFLKGQLYSNCLFDSIWKNLFISAPNILIFPWESHCWERLLMNQFLTDKKFINSLTIGYQHTGFSYGLLQHFQTNLDDKLKINPKVLFSSGKIQKEKLEKIDGLKNINKYTIGSLRCKSIPDINGVRLKLNKKIKTISFALGYNEKNYNLIINELIQLNREINIYFFVHPLNYKFKPQKKTPNNIKIKYKRDNFLISQSDLVIVDDNSLMIEGWTLGVPIIIYESDDFELTKRDWESPMLHMNKMNIKDIESLKFRNKLKISSEEYITSNYSNKYFHEINFQDFENAINNIFEQ